MEPSIVSQGAEGRIYESTFFGKPCLVKQRFPKSYRHPVLDERITKQRLVLEARNLVKVRQMGVRAPKLYLVDTNSNSLYVEDCRPYAEPVKEYLFSMDDAATNPNVMEMAASLGAVIAVLHNNALIHGDLTTSNFLVHRGDRREIIVIDLGLCYTSTLVEDMAVDLYVLERAFISTHTQCQPVMDAILEGYRQTSSNSDDVFRKLEVVRRRGRKRDMIG